jgi:hypothetical protein
MLKITIVAERASDVFEVVWTLEVISLQKSINCSPTLTSVSNLIAVEINCLKTEDGVVFVDPNVDSDD